MTGRNAPWSARKLAVGGLMLALAVIFLYMATVMPTNRLSFYALSSFCTAVIVMEYGVKAAWAFYIGAGILGIFLSPDKLDVVPYVLFFGIYGIIKYYIEKLRKLPLEYLLKLLYFNILLAGAMLLLSNFFKGTLLESFPWWIVVLILEVVFLIYDYIFTMFIQYFNERLKKMLGL